MKTFKAMTIRAAIIPAGRKVQLQDVGGGNFLIVKAETDKGEIKATTPMTLFLQAGDFSRIASLRRAPFGGAR